VSSSFFAKVTAVTKPRSAGKGDPGSSRKRDAFSPKGSVEPEYGASACAMGGPQEIRIESVKMIHCSIHALLVGRQQVHPSHYGMYGFSPGQLVNVDKGVDHACMGTPEQDDRSLRGIEKQGLIVKHEVGLRAGGVEEERTSRILEWCDAWNLARDENPFDDFGGLRRGDAQFFNVREQASIGPGQADGTPHAVLIACKLGFESRRMGVYLEVPARLEDVFQTARMIIMSMTEYHGVESIQPVAQHFCIMEHDSALTRIKKYFLLTGFDVHTQTMLGQ